ncbi:MAG: hypothetical protein ACE5FU_12300, partial [Nitrospinota bacterium]
MIILILSIFAVSVFSIARLVLYFTYFRKQKPLTGKEIRYCFKRGVHFDLSIFSTLFGLPVLLFFLPFPFTVSPVYQSFIFALWGLLFLFLLAVTAGDLIYFKYVNRHLTNELSFIFSEAGVLLRTL